MALRRFCCDDETGEIVAYDVNEETGEPFMDTNIPPLYVGLKKTKITEPIKYTKFPKCYMSNTKKFQSLKEEILAGSNKISHRLILLIPTLAFFPAYLCTLIIILEVFLHVRCHINNEKSKDTNTFYQSPFHMITSTFCGVCRDCDMASKIGELQDKRNSRRNFIPNVTL